MNTKLKRILSLLLVVAMLLTASCITAFAADAGDAQQPQESIADTEEAKEEEPTEEETPAAEPEASPEDVPLDFEARFGDQAGGMLSIGSTEFTHLDYDLDGNGGLKTVDTNLENAVTETLGTLVVENDALIATFVPDYGARLLSIYNKATGHEELYQNPLGVPYGYNGKADENGIINVNGGWQAFYYNWLMVYGGIMPTFSEPEHGKFWYLPWDCEIVANDAEKVSIKMSMKDDVDYWGTVGVKNKFNNGQTNLICSVIYTVYADKGYVEMEITLENPTEQEVNYEYWTCTTLAPGSESLTDGISRNSEIVAPLTTVNVRDNYDWMRNRPALEGSPESNGLFYRAFDEFADFSQWDRDGICYGWDLSSNWWGVINHDNEEGILRIADRNKTPGMKFWTWGYEQSYSWTGKENNSPRPYIELWGGNSKMFFEDATLGAGKTLTWKEYFYPTDGLSNITDANENGAIYITAEEDGSNYKLTGLLNTTLLGQDLTFTLWANNKKLTSAAVDGINAELAYIVSAASLKESNTIKGVLTDAKGKVLLSASIKLEVEKEVPPSFEERFGDQAGGMLSVGSTEFTHLDYTLDELGGLKTIDTNLDHAVTETLGTLVVENDALIATFVPDYGARLLSIYNKATGHEELYQNPLGVPYGYSGKADENGIINVTGGWTAFYYNWLMVYGGIMPTFSEAEHGKFWYLPWDCEIVANDAEKVSIKMSMKDDVDYWGAVGRSTKFNKGQTELICSVIYTVYADKGYVEMEITVENPTDQDANYEYWTCTTLAPGTDELTDDISRNSEIVAPLTTVNVRDNYDWMRKRPALEGSPESNGLYYRAFDEFADFAKWERDGICYGWDLSSDWWGVINHDNEEGILRIADRNKTPGMKFWTWGYEQSYSWTGKENNSPRPYIELWGGNSKMFFEDATLGAGKTLTWKEYFYPTDGLSNITDANENGAIYITAEEDGSNYKLTGLLNTTLLGQDLTFSLWANDKKLASAAVDGTSASIDVSVPAIRLADNNVATGILTDQTNRVLLTAKIAFTADHAGIVLPVNPGVPSAPSAPSTKDDQQPSTTTTRFMDVPASAYYYDAVEWAVENGITTGTSASMFSPNAACTRAQVVTFLWRAAGAPKAENRNNPFTDVSASAYYFDAVLWAVENGITTGTSATTFSPDAACTRAQIVTFLWRAEGSPRETSGSTFTDVASGAYYADAVQWAVKNGITTGTSTTRFSPDAACTRAETVTFLYRAKA